MPDGQRAQMEGASGGDEEGLFRWPWHGFNFPPIYYLKQVTEGTAQLSS